MKFPVPALLLRMPGNRKGISEGRSSALEEVP